MYGLRASDDCGGVPLETGVPLDMGLELRACYPHALLKADDPAGYSLQASAVKERHFIRLGEAMVGAFRPRRPRGTIPRARARATSFVPLIANRYPFDPCPCQKHGRYS